MDGGREGGREGKRALTDSFAHDDTGIFMKRALDDKEETDTKSDKK